MINRAKDLAIIIIFFTIIIFFCVINIFKEDTRISETERRKLAVFPNITPKTIVDKTFMNKLDKYSMDQFFKRDEFRKIKTYFELNIFRKKDIKNMYEYNGIIIKQEYPLNDKSIINFTNKINIIKQKYLNETNNIYYSIIPDKNFFVNDKYLKLDYSKIEEILKQSFENMKYINIFNCLKLEDYYSTDTHWKQECLMQVLDRISNEMSFKDKIKTNFEEKFITEFKGVYSGQLQVKTNKDNIKILTNEIIENSKVYNYETKEETKIYNMEKLSSFDRYDVFLSGATPLLIIQNENANTDKELITFRDSFGSSLIPLFIEAYKKITIIDTRYIATDYLENLVEFNDADVLFLYSTLVINNSGALK